MKDNTIKGVLTELQCQKDFIERGILVSQPITQDSKYDYIVDIKGILYKIQCKSSSQVWIPFTSQDSYRRGKQKNH